VLVFVVMSVAAGWSVAAAAAPADAPGLPDGWTATRYGPLGPADRDLLVKVRLAGLWEMPASDQAQHRAVDPKIREIGAKISAEHHALDQATRSAAVELGVDLPTEPSSDQQVWLAEMDAAEGAEFDRIYIDRLRAAHGKVFPVIAGVRAGTRNDLIRDYAAECNAAVLRHMGYLESSGLVDWQALPAPPDPVNPAEVTWLGGLGTRGGHPVFVWIVLAGAVIAGAAATIRATRTR
jgi:predicted outer membrane protein